MVAALVDEVARYLDAARVESIRDLLKAGEEGVALEILVDNVIDEDVSVSADFKSSAMKMAEVMKLKGHRWEYLLTKTKQREYPE